MFTSHKYSQGRGSVTTKLRGQNAFTLLEVTLAMGILVLLAGAVYAIVDASIRGTSELESHENRLQQESGFLSLCRQTFHALPATALFQVRIVQQGENFVPELIFRNSPGLFQWGNVSNVSFSTILGVRQQVGGLFNLSILQDSEDEIGSYLNGGTAKHSWLVLMPDLRDVQWRFFDPRTQVWAKEWKEPTVRPLFAELTLTTEAGAGKYVFWLPPVQVQ
ncbi:MAG: type II secretion system protein [Chthoniobacteraceae bacterium]